MSETLAEGYERLMGPVRSGDMTREALTKAFDAATACYDFAAAETERNAYAQFELRENTDTNARDIAKIEATAMRTVVEALDGQRSNDDYRHAEQLKLTTKNHEWQHLVTVRDEYRRNAVTDGIIQTRLHSTATLWRFRLEWLIALLRASSGEA